MKRSNTFIPPLQNSGAATSKPTISPISNGDMLLPADSIFTSLGTNALPSSRYRSYKRVDEHLGVNVGVIVEAVVCHEIVGFHGPFCFHFWEPSDGVAVDAVAGFGPVAADGFVIEEFAFFDGGVECLLKPDSRRNLESCHACLIQNQAKQRFSFHIRFCSIQASNQ